MILNRKGFALPVFYAFTGYDTSSVSWRMGKKAACNACTAYHEVTKAFKHIAIHPYLPIFRRRRTVSKVRSVYSQNVWQVQWCQNSQWGKARITRPRWEVYGKYSSRTRWTAGAHHTRSLSSWHMEKKYSITAGKFLFNHFVQPFVYIARLPKEVLGAIAKGQAGYALTFASVNLPKEKKNMR